VVYGKHGMGTCDSAAWETMCGGISHSCMQQDGRSAASSISSASSGSKGLQQPRKGKK